jgi:hypothetical protein
MPASPCSIAWHTRVSCVALALAPDREERAGLGPESAERQRHKLGARSGIRSGVLRVENGDEPIERRRGQRLRGRGAHRFRRCGAIGDEEVEIRLDEPKPADRLCEFDARRGVEGGLMLAHRRDVGGKPGLGAREFVEAVLGPVINARPGMEEDVEHGARRGTAACGNPCQSLGRTRRPLAVADRHRMTQPVRCKRGAMGDPPAAGRRRLQRRHHLAISDQRPIALGEKGADGVVAGDSLRSPGRLDRRCRERRQNRELTAAGDKGADPSRQPRLRLVERPEVPVDCAIDGLGR